MSKVDKVVETSYSHYMDATTKYGVVPVEVEEYRSLLFSAGTALRDCTDLPNDGNPYVIIKVGSLYMKAVRVGDNLQVSFMDTEAFNVLTQYKK